MTTAQLDIQTILNSNASWVRRDFGPMDELVESIKAEGIKTPILIAGDYLVYDGARRLMAAKTLGRDMIPVQFCRSWVSLLAGMIDAHNAKDTYPMTWFELRDLWDRLLKPVHEVYRRYSATASRRRNRIDGTMHQERAYSGFTTDLAKIYEVTPANLKLLRDALHRLELLRATEPEWVEELTTVIEEVNTHGRYIIQARVLKNVLEWVSQNKYTQEQGLRLFRSQLQTAPIDRPMRNRRPGLKPPAKSLSINPNAPMVPLSAIKNFADLLAQVTQQGDAIRNFNVTVRWRSDYLAEIESINTSIRRLYRLRRRLESAFQQPIPETETES